MNIIQQFLLCFVCGIQIAIYRSLGEAKESETAIVAGEKSLKVGLEWGKIVFLDSSGTDISKRISQIYHY